MFVSFHPFNPLVGNYILGCSDYYVGKHANIRHSYLRVSSGQKHQVWHKKWGGRTTDYAHKNGRGRSSSGRTEIAVNNLPPWSRAGLEDLKKQKKTRGLVRVIPRPQITPGTRLIAATRDKNRGLWILTHSPVEKNHLSVSRDPAGPTFINPLPPRALQVEESGLVSSSDTLFFIPVSVPFMTCESMWKQAQTAFHSRK